MRQFREFGVRLVVSAMSVWNMLADGGVVMVVFAVVLVKAVAVVSPKSVCSYGSGVCRGGGGGWKRCW